MIGDLRQDTSNPVRVRGEELHVLYFATKSSAGKEHRQASSEAHHQFLVNF